VIGTCAGVGAFAALGGCRGATSQDQRGVLSILASPDQALQQDAKSLQQPDWVQSVTAMECPRGLRIGLARAELGDYGSFFRAVLTFRDFDTGEDFAQWSQLFDREPVAAGVMPSQVIAWADGLQPRYSGITFLIAFDPANLRFSKTFPVATYDRYEECTVKPHLTYTSEAMDGFLTQPAPSRIVQIGTGLDYPTLTSATRSFYLPDTQIPGGRVQYSTFPLSFDCCFATQVEFVLARAGDENVAGLVTLPYQIIRGLDQSRTRLSNTTPAHRVLEATQSLTVTDVTLNQSVDEYVVHIDNFGGLSRAATMGPRGQHWHIRQRWERVSFLGTGAQKVSLIGMGVSGGQRLIVRDCLMRREDTSSINPGWLIHTAPNTIEPAQVLFERVTNETLGAGLYLIGSHGMGEIRHDVSVKDSGLGLIYGTVLLADDDPEMPMRARDRWPFELHLTGPGSRLQVSDEKMRVLALPPDTSIGGDADALAALLGRLDRPSGLGDQLMLDGSIRSLAARLGDRRGAPWKILLAGTGKAVESITLDQDYRGAKEGDILRAINSRLVRFSFSTVAIDRLIVPV
jgi:hypothetical protein